MLSYAGVAVHEDGGRQEDGGIWGKLDDQLEIPQDQMTPFGMIVGS